HLLGRQLQKCLKKRLIVRTRQPGPLKHLIVGGVELVIAERRTKQRAGRFRHSHGSHETSGSGAGMRHPRTLGGAQSQVQSKSFMTTIQISRMKVKVWRGRPAPRLLTLCGVK